MGLTSDERRVLFAASNRPDSHVECAKPREREALFDCRIALAADTELALSVRSPGEDLSVPLSVKRYLIIILFLLPAWETRVRYLLYFLGNDKSFLTHRLRLL